MSMRMSISQAAMVVFAGCGVTATTEYTAADQAVLAAMATGPTGEMGGGGGCPDPGTDCTHSNGSGVFFEEGGSASIDAPQKRITMLMITDFTNLPSGGVTFRGRYAALGIPPALGPWRWGNGTVDTAEYNLQKGLHVVRVSENATRPTWTLVDPNNPNNGSVQVTDTELLHLKLHVTFTGQSLPPVPVQLEFNNWEVIRDTNPKGDVFPNHPHLHAYNLLWSLENSSSIPTQYCYSGPNAPVPTDEVVFQEGISVDPVNGIVTSAPNVVTMSCARGAVAKAYNWGYAYADPLNAGFVPSFYQAAIHMKRAAYCGDWDHHTHDGITIGIRDSSLINTFQNSTLEARWSTNSAINGAICVNRVNQRDPGLPFDPQHDPPQCPTRSVPICPPSPGPTYLEDYKVP